MGLNGDLMGLNGDLMGLNGDLNGIEWWFSLPVYFFVRLGRCYVHFVWRLDAIPFGWTWNFGAGNLPGGAICIGASTLYMLEAIYPLLVPSIHTWDLWAFIP